MSWAFIGPSPRVRGTGIEHGVCGTRCRSIPACAGNRRSRCIGLCRTSGPSPRVRGTGSPWPARSPWPDRSIPACAGNSRTSRQQLRADFGPSPRVRGTGIKSFFMLRRMLVHPRVCGEQVPSLPPTFLGFLGPSPRVRGTARGRQTPAVMGIGPSPRVRGTVRRRAVGGVPGSVHPRVCGEQAQANDP